MDLIDHLKTVEPIQYVYGVVAVVGGMARYFNNFANGQPFSFRLFLASTFVSGFSGWMFALIGVSMNMPQSILFIMAGTGGFFGDQAMKYAFEYVTSKVPPKTTV